ncbi:hypothetical protein [Streptomyces sp. ST2-7A]|uniref:hypothetical protein n=1 Tax=Streptomyces sp. ST2-7A TaxID=2907214 RepID=UPI001F3C7A2A|nr:hypothetical protein [Streptomyces sp. ST2-7A]MCE7083474.1 hypothetical protein [Streptomyces sp. ST2-7A]
MRIRRSRLTADFVQLPNGTVRDERLSYMARGILAELLSRPDGWETTADDLWRRAAQARPENKGEGRRAFRAAFAELKDRGYLTAATERLPGGRHGTVLTVHDLPQGGDVSAGETDVPHGGTSEDGPGSTGVPHAGTSVRAGETGPAAGDTDVPPAGTSVSPAERDVSAGRSDVPHAGTSLRRQKKKTEKKKTGLGDGRQATSGSGEPGTSGCAAPNKITPNEEPPPAHPDDNDDQEAGHDDPLPGPALDEPGPTGPVGLVLAALPPALRAGLPELLPTIVTDTIRRELRRNITVDQLIARADRRWNLHRFVLDADVDGGGHGLDSPVGVAAALLRRGECTHPRCGDGFDLDTGAPCATCERTRQDRAAEQKAPAAPSRAPLKAVPAPAGHTGRTTGPRAPQGPVQPPLLQILPMNPAPPAREPKPLDPTVRRCTDCDKPVMPRRDATPDLCGACRTDQRRHA